MVSRFCAFECGNAAHGERAEAARIARGEDAVAAHHDEGECALDAAKRVGDGVDQRLLFGERDELNDDFGVAVGLEDRALALEPGADLRGLTRLPLWAMAMSPWWTRRGWAAH